MPLQKLQFKPGVNRESTTLANEGGWFESEKVRFRSGFPEKIGGWVKDTGSTDAALKPTTGAFWGTCRALWAWINLVGYNLLGVGTHLKYYIQNGPGGTFHDVTPIRTVTGAGEATFAATNGSNIITVTDNGHGAQAGDFVTYSSAAGLGGAVTASILNAEHRVLAVISNNVYTIQLSVTATAGDVGNGGSATIATYQIAVGSDVYTTGVGWGAGGWGGVTTGYASTGWGSPAPAGLGIGIQLRLWSQSNFGEDLIFNPRGGALYYWANTTPATIFNRAQLLGPSTTVVTKAGSVSVDADCPSIANLVATSDASRFVIAFGCNDYGSVAQDPLLVRWSDQEAFGTWTPSATNQAGSYRLSSGSEIITAKQTRQEILVWTDAALYSMQYLGPPYVWGFQIMAENISIMGPNTVATANNITYWMGNDKFYIYSGRVETLPCSLRQYVFNDINMAQSYQFFAGTNEGYNEVWWYYCSANSSVVDRYVVYNHLERIWYYGTLSRTAWLDTPLRDYPTAATPGNVLVYHENGTDDGTTNPPSPIEAYIQSADFDIGDGHNFGFVWRIIPDVTFDGSSVNNPFVTFTVRPRQNPGNNYGTDNVPAVTSAQNYQGQRAYTVQQFTPQVYVRMRGRQMAFKVGSSGLGVSWQLGAPRIDVRPDGRR